MLLMAFGQSTMRRTQVQLWYNPFKEGREDVNDDARPGLPSTLPNDENIETVKNMISAIRRNNIREVADDIIWLMLRNFFYGCFRHEIEVAVV